MYQGLKLGLGCKRHVKYSSSSISNNGQMICSSTNRPNIKLEIRKKTTFLSIINNLIVYKFLIAKILLITERKLIGQ